MMHGVFSVRGQRLIATPPQEEQRNAVRYQITVQPVLVAFLRLTFEPRRKRLRDLNSSTSAEILRLSYKSWC